MKCEHCTWFVVETEMVTDHDAPPMVDARGRPRRQWKWVPLDHGQCRFNPPEAGKGFPVVASDAWCRQFKDRVDG